MARHVKPDQSTLLAALNASADENDGTPVWSAVAKVTGATRERLKRVWHNRENIVRLVSKPAETPSPESALSDPLAAEPSTYFAHQHVQIDTDIDAARQAAPGAVAGLRKLQIDVYDRYRAAKHEELKRAPKRTAAEVEAELRRASREMPVSQALAVLDEFRKRRIA